MIKLNDTSPLGSDRPLEREYEGWISWLIEDYLTSLGYEVDVYSVSPADEKTFPADEVISGRDIAFALQFKRPQFFPASGAIKWPLYLDQHSLIKEKYPNIFYALPTFANRKAKALALSHFLIFHPSWKYPLDNSYWWQKNGELLIIQKHSIAHFRDEDGRVRSKRERAYALRWGAFIEHLQLGKIANSPSSLVHALKAARRAAGKQSSELPEEEESGDQTVVKYASADDLLYANEIDAPPAEGGNDDETIVLFLLSGKSA